MAKQLRIRPSELAGIEDEVTAWSFDRAVLAFGNALESRLHQISRDSKKAKEGERKANRELQKWLTSADAPGTVKGRFRDPMSVIRK